MRVLYWGQGEARDLGSSSMLGRCSRRRKEVCVCVCVCW
jgi:hypothetical protein